MTPAGTDALDVLRSRDVFAKLRSTLRQLGLAEEEKFGVGVFFIMISRFRPNPLRLTICEKTAGSARFIVQRVSKLFQSGTTQDIFSQKGWSRFAEHPAHTVAYVPDWADWLIGGTRIETSENGVTRVSLGEKDGRVVETPHTIETPFACIALEYPQANMSRSRWLSMKLPAPRWDTANGMASLSVREISTWLEVQRLLEERAQLPIVLPDWGDVVFEQICRESGSALHLPAFVQAWKTTSLLRSFGRDICKAEAGRQRLLQANFEDLAVTSLLLRGLFREGRWFPSVREICNKVFPVGANYGVMHPLSGKGVSYKHESETPPIRYQSVLDS